MNGSSHPIIIGVLVTLSAAVRPAISHAEEAPLMIQTIDRLAVSEEFRASEFEELANLPMSSVPLLTQTLREVKSTTRGQLPFMLLASKVNQYQHQLPRAVLDDAVDALLEKIQPRDHSTDLAKTTLRSKLQDVAYIEDARLVEGVRKARVFLGMEPDMADAAYQSSMPGAAAAAASAMAGKLPHPAAASADAIAPTSWLAWVMMAAGAMGLLWILLKPKAAAKPSGGSR